MTKIEIKQVAGEEMLEVVHPLTTYAFRPSPPLFDKKEWQEMIRGRKGVVDFGLYENGVPVANVASVFMTQNVRGRVYKMGGIWGVATHPSSRRKGYSRRLMERMLAHLRDEGYPISCLYPFRESFYERMGYVNFPQPLTAKFPSKVLSPLVKGDLDGEVEIHSIGEAFDLYRDYLRDLQDSVHGMGLFDFPDKTRAQKGDNWWIALAKVDDEQVGLMIYDLRGEEVTKFTLRAIRFLNRTAQGKYLLLQWIARHIDQAEQVEIWLPPYERPETWLADIRPQFEPAFFAPMGRVLDVSQIGGMGVGPGSFTARLRDPFCPWNEGTWKFESLNGTLHVGSGEDSDCEMSIHALAALIYGTHDPDVFSLRGWGDPGEGVGETMRAMFPAKLPFLCEIF